jgi:hypothetical protein
LICAAASQAGLTHRYSFTDNADDSVGTAHGTVQGGATAGGGTAYLPGVAGDYIELPPGIISNYTALTIEMWVDAGANGNWSELFAFGDQTSGGLGANMIMFTPHAGSAPPDFRMSYAQGSPGYTDEKVVNGVGILDGLGPINVTCVYDPPNNTMSLYTNGALVGTLSPVTTGAKGFSFTNVYNRFSWLGRSLYNGDAAYTGSIDEFRVYNHALSPLEAYVNANAGPDTVVNNIVIQSLKWNVTTNMVVGSRQPTTVTFNTAAYGSVTLPNATEPAYSSSDPSIVKVTAQGQLFAMKVGSATVSAVYNNTTNQALVVVSGPKLIHRYSFTDNANDLVGGAHGTLMNGAELVGGALVLAGGVSSSDPGCAYLDLPNGMMTNLTAATFEAWVTDNGSANWARVWDFGNSAGGEGISDTGSRYLFLSFPTASATIQGNIHINDRGGDASVIGPRVPAGQEVHLVWSSDIANHTSWLYINGALAAVNDNTTVAPADIGNSLNNWLGRSQYGGDATFAGTINEFRIYTGAVDPFQVTLNAASGPDKAVSDPGALQALRLTIGTNIVYNGGFPVGMTVYADYANVTNVNVTTLAGMVLSSSNPSIVSVSPNGSLLGSAVGPAEITATFGGLSGKLTVNVQQLPGYAKANLVHRYSFNDGTANDSAGSANGTLAGNGAVIADGQVTLPGGTASNADPSTIAGYVDLPNGIISVLNDASFEAWITWDTASQWQRIFDFGTSNGGEDISDGNGNYLFLSPQGSGNNYQFSVRDPATAGEPAPAIAARPLPTGQETYVAVVYSHTDNITRLYSNSVPVAFAAAPVALNTINDVNNWLGRSQWGDAMFAGKINEFRIWNGALLPEEIATHIAAGPNALEPVTGPKLTVAVSGQNLVISWPASATGYVLEHTAQVAAPASWTTVTATPTTANGITSVTVPIAAGPEFFRLKK